MNARTFPHTLAALAAYDAGAADRADTWARAESAADVDAADSADRDALRLVQRAFHQDTADINSMDHCALADIDFMRRCAARACPTCPHGRGFRCGQCWPARG